MDGRTWDNEFSNVQYTAGSLACDYVTRYLASEGYALEVNPYFDVPERLSESMLTMCDLFQQRFHNRYITNLRNAYLGVKARDIDIRLFFNALDSLFSSGISWSRIVAMYAFGGSIALTYARQGRREMVTAVPEWMMLYIRRDITRWIQANGGWDSFIQFSQDVLNGNYVEEVKKDSAALYLGISFLFAVVAYYTYRRFRG